MEISVELTLSPLQKDYEDHIIAFIKTLRASEFVIKETPLSTQIFGDYDAVMSFLKDAIKNCFNEMSSGLLYMKIVKSNRENYEPHF